MHFINLNFLRLRELIKLLYNPIFAIYVWFLKCLGIINFSVPPNSNMRRTSAKSIWRYWYSGLTTSLPINVHAQASGINPSHSNDVLDFGCGVGGQIRLMKKYFPQSQLTGCDVDPSSIRWLKKNYPSVNFVQVYPNDPVPFADSSFNLIYSISTFSHFSVEVSKFYFEELARVTKSQGVLILSVEGDHAIKTVATELGISKDEITDKVQASGAFHLTYEWIKQRKKSDYRPISESVDITTYFDDEYGTTVFSEHFFTTLATSVGLTFLHKSIGTCCDRQDIYVFKKD